MTTRRTCAAVLITLLLLLAGASLSPPSGAQTSSTSVSVIEQPWDCIDRSLRVTDAYDVVLVDHVVWATQVSTCTPLWDGGDHFVHRYEISVLDGHWPVLIEWGFTPTDETAGVKHHLYEDGHLGPVYHPSQPGFPPSFVALVGSRQTTTTTVLPSPVVTVPTVSTSTSEPTLQSLPTVTLVGVEAATTDGPTSIATIPVTGAEIWVSLALGVLLVAVGLVLAWKTRERSHPDAPNP